MVSEDSFRGIKKDFGQCQIKTCQNRKENLNQ